MAARKNSTKRKMSVAANSAVSQNNIVECSEEMADIIKRIVVREGEDSEVVICIVVSCGGGLINGTTDHFSCASWVFLVAGLNNYYKCLYK